MHVYISDLNIFIYNINYMNIYRYVNTCKYFQNIYCMYVYLYIHNKYTQSTYIMQTKTFILDVINRD